MFHLKISVFIFTIFISISCHAANNVWKQSHDFEAKGDFEQAAAALESAIAVKDEYALLRYAYLKYKQGEYNDSIKYYEKAMRLNPKSIDAKLGMTLPYIAQGRWRQVILRSEQVLLKSEGNYTAHQRLMQAESGSKKWHTLGRRSAKLTTLFPMDVETYVYHARASARYGNTKKATASYKNVLKRDPYNTEALDYIENN